VNFYIKIQYCTSFILTFTIILDHNGLFGYVTSEVKRLHSMD